MEILCVNIPGKCYCCGETDVNFVICRLKDNKIILLCHDCCTTILDILTREGIKSKKTEEKKKE
ncbi:MAG: hypothetical protein DRP03_03855 [Candidatus Aenigmatarchaeota archaeon]|nr:MAG: hypothetical protein DRP03_03855 [Candidatus Aenigmarchaeota archaeon]